MSNAITIEKPRLSVKFQVIATLAAVVGAVAVPQLFHLLGDVTGMGTAFGRVFHPMHLPIILVGLLAGPYAGFIAGALGPLASFLMSGMPMAALLPFMMIELAAYGLFAGLLRNAKMPSIVKVVISQISGRLVYGGAILIAVYAFSNNSIGLESVKNSVVNGLPGLILQWCFIPLILFRIQNRESK